MHKTYQVLISLFKVRKAVKIVIIVIIAIIIAYLSYPAYIILSTSLTPNERGIYVRDICLDNNSEWFGYDICLDMDANACHALNGTYNECDHLCGMKAKYINGDEVCPYTCAQTCEIP